MKKVPIGAVVRKDESVVGEEWFNEMFYKGRVVHDYSTIEKGRVTLFFAKEEVVVPETELVEIK